MVALEVEQDKDNQVKEQVILLLLVHHKAIQVTTIYLKKEEQVEVVQVLLVHVLTGVMELLHL